MGKLNNNQSSLYIIEDDLTTKRNHSNATTNHTSNSSTNATKQTTTTDVKLQQNPNLFTLLIHHPSFAHKNLSQDHLVYRAEGNANLVLSLPETRQVLRLRKSSDSAKSQTLDELKDCIAYTKFVSAIISNNLTCQPELVHFEIDHFNNFNNWLLNLRPADRLNKEIRCRYGTLYPDAAFLPASLEAQQHTKVQQAHPFTKKANTFCVEIKPKQGWTAFGRNGESILKRHNLKFHDDVRLCRFCCMQYLKLSKGSVKEVSKYCPIDLFSGLPHRMHRAILGLIETPQNNLRIFKNGNLIYGDKTGTFEESEDIFSTLKANKVEKHRHRKMLADLLVKILLKDYDDCHRHSDHMDLIKNVPSPAMDEETSIDYCNREEVVLLSSLDKNKTNCDVIDYNKLPMGCALRSILDTQLLAKKSLSNIDEFDETRTLSQYIDGILKKQNSFLHVAATQAEASETGLQHYDKFEQYLIGATALDCSMMVVFKEFNRNDEDVHINENHLITFNGRQYISNISVMDLDPKAPTHFLKYLKQTESSMVVFTNAVTATTTTAL